MSWLKQAKMEDFDDRNRVNRGIHRLAEISDNLSYAAELVFMTARGARGMVAEIRSDKVMSSYPDIEDVLREADAMALDAPRKFSAICKAAAAAIRDIVAGLEQERSEFVNETMPKKIKGLVDE